MAAQIIPGSRGSKIIVYRGFRYQNKQTHLTKYTGNVGKMGIP